MSHEGLREREEVQGNVWLYIGSDTLGFKFLLYSMFCSVKFYFGYILGVTVFVYKYIIHYTSLVFVVSDYNLYDICLV